jgi:hypothetical protein
MSERNDLSGELRWFIRNQDELVKSYNGKHLAIRDGSVIGVYDTFRSAYEDVVDRGLLGRVQLQECIAGPGAYTTCCYNPNITLSEV